MKHARKLLLAILTAAMILTGCAGTNPGTEGDPNNPQPVPQELAVKTSNGYSIIDLLYAAKGGNVVISSTSINMALTMLLEGANGTSQKQLEEYLGYSKEEAKNLAKTLMEYYEELSSGYGKDQLRITIANSLWADKDQSIREEYSKLLEEYFRAEAASLDFQDAASAERINGWVSEKTNGLIKEIVDGNTLKQLAAILINALYFKAAWADEYHGSEKGTFNNESADMLNCITGTYFENEHAVAFAKDFYGPFEFIAILPKETGEFTLSSLDIDSLLASRSYEYDVITSMPKFKNEYSTSLNDVLKALGVVDVFTAASDLSDIAEELCVDEVIHKTYISVDETGVEAAAVTAIMVKNTALPMEKEKKEVIIDRPFVFMIYDTVNETAVFTGKIVTVK